MHLHDTILMQYCYRLILSRESVYFSTEVLSPTVSLLLIFFFDKYLYIYTLKFFRIGYRIVFLIFSIQFYMMVIVTKIEVTSPNNINISMDCKSTNYNE